MNTNSNIILETKSVSEISGQFFVPAYQRGYRWGKEATRLLEDIMEIDEKSDYRYCLQPIVVKKRSDGSYELIDGQQRLTTLFLIYKVVGKMFPFAKANYALTYEVRQRSEEYLNNISESSDESNIDFYFMKKAYLSIENWFQERMKQKLTAPYDFLKLLTERVDIIWYEVGPDEDSNALFQRLNIGKIPLTSSELVKAIFLCASSKKDIRTERQQEIALQWDNIEKELHDDAFWYFLTNKRILEYQTRIDLVLNLISGHFDDADKYATFFYFDEKRKTEDLLDIWEEIQHTYLILRDWYKNHELYHLIGYLIATGKSIKEIYELSLNKTKTAFINALKEMIKKTVDIKDRNYGELSYENTTDRNAISKLLLLFNVLSTENNGEQSEWFAFDKFKSSNWSLEHIHAQQSQGMNTEAQWKEWVRLHIPSVKLLNKDDLELNELMENSIKDDHTLKGEEFQDIRERAEKILSEDMNVGYLHSISNLALLKKDDNAALNNSTFDVKRNEIVEMDKRGQFIPFCTRMVFLKYYTPSDKNSVHFWGQADREYYIDYMNKVLSDYIEPIVLLKEEEVNG
ncbi:MAG: DUF262 domain-containing protein [Firmicutes bacterium]|uniref:DUF262 domain-containing protein n=1 Tax=Candidatus Scatoplasma merdavium TaxID=2840932 RepID=A0A9D9D636_9BACL|nr:DUF262 domain-containing protein [Candidatus Scatoplasma merdavium]